MRTSSPLTWLALASLTLAFACSGDKDDTGGSATETDADTDADADSDADADADTDADTDADADADPTCTTDICATYGAAVPLVAGQITDAAAADPQFAPYFAPLVARGPEAVDAFKASLAAFISDAYGCSTGAYTGPDMVTVHTGMGITQAEYDDFITMIAGILAADGVPADDINYCFAPPLVDPAFSSTIVGH